MPPASSQERNTLKPFTAIAAACSATVWPFLFRVSFTLTPEALSFETWPRVSTACALVPAAVCSMPASSTPWVASAISPAVPCTVYCWRPAGS